MDEDYKYMYKINESILVIKSTKPLGLWLCTLVVMSPCLLQVHDHCIRSRVLSSATRLQ